MGNRRDLWNPSLIDPKMNTGQHDFIKLKSMLKDKELVRRALDEQNERFLNMIIKRSSAQIINCPNAMNYSASVSSIW